MNDDFNIPLDEIPDEWLAPDGSLQTLEVKSLETKVSDAGNMMAVLVWQIAEGEHKGLQGRSNFVFGPADQMSDPKAWKSSSGAREFKKFSAALGFGGTISTKQFADVVGYRFDSVMGQEPANAQFRARNVIRRDSYYPEGQGPNGNERPTFTAPAKAQASTAPVAPSRSAAVAPVRPQAPARPGPQRPVPRPAAVEEEEGQG